LVRRSSSSTAGLMDACSQGLALVHYLAQRKRFLWDTGWIKCLFWGCLGGVKGYLGVFYGYNLCRKRLKLS
jgi:hypothetical protein